MTLRPFRVKIHHGIADSTLNLVPMRHLYDDEWNGWNLGANMALYFRGHASSEIDLECIGDQSYYDDRYRQIYRKTYFNKGKYLDGLTRALCDLLGTDWETFQYFSYWDRHGIDKIAAIRQRVKERCKEMYGIDWF